MPNKSETPANVEDVGQPKREASLAAPTGYAALYDAAKKASEQWSPFTQNHDPSFIAALRDAYYQGYVSGAYVTDRDGLARHSDELCSASDASASAIGSESELRKT